MGLVGSAVGSFRRLGRAEPKVATQMHCAYHPSRALGRSPQTQHPGRRLPERRRHFGPHRSRFWSLARFRSCRLFRGATRPPRGTQAPTPTAGACCTTRTPCSDTSPARSPPARGSRASSSCTTPGSTRARPFPWWSETASGSAACSPRASSPSRSRSSGCCRSSRSDLRIRALWSGYIRGGDIRPDSASQRTGQSAAGRAGRLAREPRHPTPTFVWLIPARAWPVSHPGFCPGVGPTMSSSIRTQSGAAHRF